MPFKEVCMWGGSHVSRSSAVGPQERIKLVGYYFVNIMGTSALKRKCIMDSKKLIPQLDLVTVKSIE